MQTPLDTAIEAARAAGRILLEQLGRTAVREKGPSDLVTDADLASQRVIEDMLMTRFPQFVFLGEESPAAQRESALASGSPVWIVDPIDGTANYVHKLPGFSVSISLVERGRVRAGVVYDPIADNMYAADDSGRVTKNNKPLRTSGCQQLSKALVCCSFRPAVQRNDPEVIQFLNVLEKCQSLRRLGSAALNLCYVGEGCLDAYWASSVKTWDVAAGYLIAKNAGAHFSQIDGSAFDLWDPKFVTSATPELHRAMLDALKV